MADLFFACNWIVRPIAPFFGPLLHTAKELGLKLVIIGRIRTNDQGLAIWPLAIQAPTLAALDQFIQTEGARMSMTDWFPVSGEYLSDGVDFATLFPIEPSSLDGLMSYGCRNEALLDRLNAEGQEHLFFSCDWVIRSDQLQQFREIVARATELKCLIYRLWHRKVGDICIQRFGIRIPSTPEGDAFRREFQSRLNPTDWGVIAEEEFYSSMPFRGVYGVDEFIEANKGCVSPNDIHKGTTTSK